MARARVIALLACAVALCAVPPTAAHAGTAPPPTVTLMSPAAGSILTRQPTFSGVGGILPTDSQVVVRVCSGFVSACKSGALENLSAAVDPTTGDYSTRPNPSLADGGYTAQAEQDDTLTGAQGFSSPVQFRIKIHPPAVTLAQPASGSRLTAPMLVFGGRAGTALGDSSQVTVLLYRGASASGTAIAKLRTTVSGSSWSVAGPSHLARGLYAAVATQRDDAGHTGRSSPSTFRIVPVPRTIGPTVSLNRAGFAAIRIGCPAASGACTGDVLVVTAGRFQPVPGGPSGRLRVIFAYVSIPAGQSLVVRRPVLGEVAGVLRHHPGALLRVTVAFSRLGQVASGLRHLRLTP